MIRDTHYTLSEAFDLIGRHLHGNAWTGDELDVRWCPLTKGDITTRQARKEKAVEPSRFPGGDGVGGAPEQIMCLLERARDEQMTLRDIIRAEMIMEKGPEEDVELLLIDNEAIGWIEQLQMTANHESLRKLRSGSPLSNADFAILDKLEGEYCATERRKSVVHWITRRAWSGDDSETILTGYVHTPDDGKIEPIKTHCWGARSFAFTLWNDKATMDNQSWSADGVLVFLKSQLDTVLREAKITEPVESAELGQTQGQAGGISTDDQPPSRREQRIQETQAKYRRWYDRSKEIKADDKSRRPIEIARLIAKKEMGTGNPKASAETIKRRLNKDHLGWAD